MIDRIILEANLSFSSILSVKHAHMNDDAFLDMILVVGVEEPDACTLGSEIYIFYNNKEGEFHEIDDRIPESLSSMFKRGSTPIDLAHTRMSLKIVPKQKPTISVLSLISDFGVERRDFDRSGENMMMAKSNKGWGKGMSR